MTLSIQTLGVLAALAFAAPQAKPAPHSPPQAPQSSNARQDSASKYLQPLPIRAAACVARSRGSVGAVRSALRDLGTAGWAMCRLRAGGGTAWSQFAQNAAQDREQFLRALPSAMSGSSGRSGSARSQARALMQRTRQDLAYLRQLGRVEGNGAISAFEARAQYRRSWLKAQSAVGRLSRLVNALPDQAALRVARRTFEEIHDTVSAANR